MKRKIIIKSLIFPLYFFVFPLTAFAKNFNVSDLVESDANPAKNITNISIAGLLKGNGVDIINLVFIIIGLVFFANLIIVGWEFMMSSGDPKKVASANTRLQNGLFGIIMATAAFVIVRLITNILGLGNLF